MPGFPSPSSRPTTSAPSPPPSSTCRPGRAASPISPASPRPRAIRRGGRARFVLAVERWNPGGGWAPARGRVSATVDGTVDAWRIGQHVRLSGPLAEPRGPNGPGQFNARSFLADRRIYYELRASEPDTVRLDDPVRLSDRLGRWGEEVRRWAVVQLGKGVEGDPLAGPVAAGFILGRKDLVPPLVLAHFRATGTYHLFSVSGGNMAVLLSLALAGLRLGGAIRWRWGWLAAPVLFFYALTSGGQAGLTRALLSAVIVLGAWSLGRSVTALNLWSLTLLAVLAFLPEAVRDMGFQFSFTVVLALIVLTPPLARLLGAPLKLDPFIPHRFATPRQKLQSHANLWASGLLAGCAAAWIGSTTLELFYFHQLCLVSPLANLVAVPTAWLIFLVGLFSLLGGSVSGTLSILLNNANWALVKFLVATVTCLAQLPSASVYFGPPGFSDAEPQFVVMRAGYGTTVLLRHQGHAWLLNPSDERSFFYTVEPARKYLGISRLDGVVLTQWSSADAAAARFVPQVVPAGSFHASPVNPRLASAWAAPFVDGALPIVPWSADETETLSPGLTVSVLSPPAAEQAGTAADRGLVLLFDYHGARMLYAGETGFPVEQRLLENHADLAAAVLVQGQHAKTRNFLPAWIGQVRPRELVLIGQRSSSELHPELFGDLPATERPRVWETEEAGAVVVTLHQDGTATVRRWDASE
jgi:ComEC/Rec2-related protein